MMDLEAAVREAINTSPVDHIVTVNCAEELIAHIVQVLEKEM